MQVLRCKTVDSEQDLTRLAEIALLQAEPNTDTRIEVGQLLYETFFSVDLDTTLCDVSLEDAPFDCLPLARLLIDLVLADASIHRVIDSQRLFLLSVVLI